MNELNESVIAITVENSSTIFSDGWTYDVAHDGRKHAPVYITEDKW